MLHSRNDLTPDRILAVEEMPVLEHDEELAVGTVRVLRPRHADHAPVERDLGKLGRNVRSVGSAGARPAQVEILLHVAVGNIAGLRHEPVDHPMETHVVIGAFRGQFPDLLDVLRRHVGQHPHHHVTVLEGDGQRVFGILYVSQWTLLAFVGADPRGCESALEGVFSTRRRSPVAEGSGCGKLCGMTEAPVTFGPFLLPDRQGPLLRDGAPVPLGPRALEVLAALARDLDAVVTKSVLIDRVWRGTAVEEGNLTVQIAALRQALGQTPDGQSWILTVPRRGYRLLAGARTPLPPPDILPVLDVAPVRCLTPQTLPADAAAGLADDMVTALDRIPGLQVQPPGPAPHRSGADYALHAGLRRAGELVRISLRLVDGATGAQVWSAQLDGTANGLFDLQDRAARIAAAAAEPAIRKAELARSQRDRPGGSDARDVRLQTLPLLLTETDSANRAAFTRITAALDRAPDNAELHMLAAWALEHRHTMGWPALGADDVERCLHHTRRALELAEGDPMITAQCGMCLLQVAHEYDWALAVLDAATDSNPNNPMAATAAAIGHTHCGDLETAAALLDRVELLQVRHPWSHISLCARAHLLILQDQDAEALDFANRALALNPNFDPIHWMLIAANARLGRPETARRCRETLQRLSPGATVSRIVAGQPASLPDRFAPVAEGLRRAGLPET